MTTLIVIPTNPELKLLRQAFEQYGYETEPAVIGRLSGLMIPGLKSFMTPGGLGKTQIAVQTQHLIDSHTWNLVICTGAAGSLVPGINIGDVIIATETIEHDMRKTGRPLQPCFPGAETELVRVRALCGEISGFKLHFGPIASGDEDIVEEHRRHQLSLQTNALAAAWEGAGAARAARFSGLPFLEVRGITDLADENVPNEFRMNLAAAMSHVGYVLKLLLEHG